MFDQLKAAISEGGKPAYLQLFEALTLRLRRPPLGIGEYFDYGIWHKSITPELRDEFIGWRQSAALDQLLNADASRALANDKLINYMISLSLANARDASALANDKLINYMILRAQRYPIPEPVATYSPSGRRIADEPLLRSLDEVRAFLEQDIYPFYAKPISAGYGRDVRGVTGRDDQNLKLMDGSKVTVDDFLVPFGFTPYQGMLFQRPLKAHPSIAELTGTEAISCVRFICFVTPEGPKIHTAFWKITVGNNMLDNFSHGHYGNCLGAIDLDLGRVTRVIAHIGPKGAIENHPSTNKRLIGFTLPNWLQALELVQSVSANFPGLRLQNWDVAFCPDGPVLVELNTESDLAVPQAITGRGLLNRRLHQILSAISCSDEENRRAILARL